MATRSSEIGTGTVPKPTLPENLPIPRRKLSDVVLERLLGMVNSGKIKPGDTLPSERQLMAAFEVGRPVVREALQSLEQMGMIEINHGERARLVSPTPDTLLDKIRASAQHLLNTSPGSLDHFKEARLMFEQAMVRRAVACATEEDISRLRGTVSLLASARQATAEFISADMLFHEAIAAISGNPLFAALSKAMLDWLTHFSVQTVHQPGAENVTLAEHMEILDRIEAHDEEGAVKAMRDHLTRANRLYRVTGADNLAGSQ
jgi:GntR family transcriptional regulator, sialic acid-inducible nan operon repressor